MELLEFHPVDVPPYQGERDWPSRTQRKERWSHLRSGHVLTFRKGPKQVIAPIPAAFLEPIIFEQLRNPAAFKSVLEFHSGGPGDGENEAQIEAFFKKQARGLVVFGPPRTSRTRAVFARLCQLYVWGVENFCWIRSYELEAQLLGNGDLCRPDVPTLSELATFEGNVFIDDVDIPTFAPKYAEAVHQILN